MGSMPNLQLVMLCLKQESQGGLEGEEAVVLVREGELVEPRGVEPLTSAVRLLRSPN
jgi:hypothetical protein